MARADHVGSMLQEAFPGLRVTSTVRTKAQQDALVAAGATKARNSQHLHGDGLDIVLPANVKPVQVRTFLLSKGYNPGEFLNESGKGSGQGTGAHLHIGLAPKPAKGGDPASADGGSTYDRVSRQRAENSGPDLNAVYRAYQNTGKPGGMTRQDAAQYERDVLDGHIMLGRGQSIRKKPAAPVLDTGVIRAFNSHAMDDDPEMRASVLKDVRDGVYALPRGVTLKAPAQRTAGERFGMGARGVLTGVAGLGDIISSPVRLAANIAGIPGMDPNGLRNSAEQAADYLGLAKPESDKENLVNAIVEGGTQGLATAGAALPLAEANGATGVIAKALSSSPVIDTVSGATSGASSEVARQTGAGPVGQLAAGVVGGGLPALAHPIVTARIGRNVGKDIAETIKAPKETLIDANGDLTPDGREVAAQNGITPAELKQAFGEAPPDVQRGVANDSAESLPVARAVGEEPLPIEPAAKNAVPAQEVAPATTEATATPEAIPVPAESPLPATAKARMDEAASEQIPLTRGEATQDFAIQDAEQTLRASTTKEGEQARAFKIQQQDAIKDAAQRFQEAFGDTSLNATDRGEIVQNAVRDMRDLGAAGVSALYKHAEQLGGEGLGLITDDIKRVATDILIDEGVPEAVKRSISQQLARYGLVGKAEKMNEVGITKVTLEDGSSVSFRGEPEQLTVANAEQLRKAVNKLYDLDPSHQSQALKPVIDDAVEEAIQAAANNPALQAKGVAEAYKAARAAHQVQKQTFSAKDIVQQIADFKKGTATDALKAENVIKAIMGTGPEALTNLRKIKTVLLSGGTDGSKAAWEAIKLHGVADIFGKARIENANAGNGAISAISGAKLSTAIEKFGIPKLKILLDQKEFGDLMKLRRIISNATVPISGTTNPSGSAYKIMKFITPLASRFSGLPGVGPAVDIVSHLAKQAKEAANSRETLKGIAEYTPEQAAKEPLKIEAAADKKAQEFLKSFIEIAGSDRLIAPIIAAGSQQGAEK